VLDTLCQIFKDVSTVAATGL